MNVDTNDLIVDRTWREVIDEPRPIGPTVRTIVAGWSTPAPIVSHGIKVEGLGR